MLIGKLALSCKVLIQVFCPEYILNRVSIRFETINDIIQTLPKILSNKASSELDLQNVRMCYY